MKLSRPGRRFVAGIAGALLLLCQTAMAAQACSLAAAAAGESALSGICHDIVPPTGDTPGHAQQQNCPTELLSASFAKLDVPPAVDLPALQVQPAWLQAAAREGLIPIAVPARAVSLPLTIVHCCLRN
jgi:hypothetical protein